jgi:hypothetical protein
MQEKRGLKERLMEVMISMMRNEMVFEFNSHERFSFSSIKKEEK